MRSRAITLTLATTCTAWLAVMWAWRNLDEFFGAGQ